MFSSSNINNLIYVSLGPSSWDTDQRESLEEGDLLIRYKPRAETETMVSWAWGNILSSKLLQDVHTTVMYKNPHLHFPNNENEHKLLLLLKSNLPDVNEV